MEEITLYSAVLCPFSHRSRLVLAEKGLAAKIVDIDLRNKPPGFEAISPYGQVPVLAHGSFRVWESAIINEYLEEAFPAVALLPRDPTQRAAARIWIHFADNRLFAASAQLLHANDPQAWVAPRAQLAEDLRFIEREVFGRSGSGPYWLGADYGLVDATFYPWFEQVAALVEFRGLRLPDDLRRLDRWRRAVADRASVKSIAKPPEFYIEAYARLAKEMARGAPQ